MDDSKILTAAAIVIISVGLNIILIGSLSSDIKDFENKIDKWKSDFYKEMKDFHGRLCSIEEKNKR